MFIYFESTKVTNRWDTPQFFSPHNLPNFPCSRAELEQCYGS
jgi:hypothetical protein